MGNVFEEKEAFEYFFIFIFLNIQQKNIISSFMSDQDGMRFCAGDLIVILKQRKKEISLKKKRNMNLL